MDHHEHDQQRDHQDEHVAVPDGRPIDPDTGHPVEPELEGRSVVPEQDPAPGPTGEDWDEVQEEASQPE